MSEPQQQQDGPTAIKDPAGGSAAHPLQLLVVIVIFALAIGVYIYFTGGDHDSSRHAPDGGHGTTQQA